MSKRICDRCHCEISPGEDFFASRDFGKDSDEVWCNGCIDYILEDALFMMDVKEKAELLGYGVYVDEPEEEIEVVLQIPGQMDMFGGMS